MDYADEEYEMLQKEKSDLKFVFKVLACQNPECVYYLIPPIQQCRGGHSFCAFCIWKETCPICSQSIIGTKCQALENIVSLLLVPCKNKNVGCDEVYPPGLKLDHEEQCIYNYVKCIHSGCGWRGERINLWRHLTEVHPESMVQSDNLVIEVPLNITATFIYHKILKYWDHYFGVKVSYDIFNNKLYAGVRQAGGSFVQGITYSFSMESSKVKGKHTYSYERQTYDSQRRFRFVFTSEDCFVVTKEFLDEFFPSKPASIDLYLHIKKMEPNPTQAQTHHQSTPQVMSVSYETPFSSISSKEPETSNENETNKKTRLSSETKNEKNEKIEKSDKNDKSDGNEQGDKNEKNEKSDKNEKNEKSDKNEKKEKSDKNEKNEKGDKNEKNEKGDKKEKNEKGDKNEKNEKGDKKEKNEKGDKNEKDEKSDKNEKNEKSEKNEKNEKNENIEKNDGNEKPGRISEVAPK